MFQKITFTREFQSQKKDFNDTKKDFKKSCINQQIPKEPVLSIQKFQKFRFETSSYHFFKQLCSKPKTADNVSTEKFMLKLSNRIAPKRTT